MNEADYDVKINNQQTVIDSCNKKISELENTIEELKLLKSKIISLQESTHVAANTAVSKIHNWAGFFAGASSVLNVNFFGNMIDAAKGTAYKNADASLTEAKEIVQKKIDELSREISQNENTIRNSKKSITTLKIQKKNSNASKTE